jgi:hypothetical protein
MRGHDWNERLNENGIINCPEFGVPSHGVDRW